MSSDRQAVAGTLNGKFMRTMRNSYVNRNPSRGEDGAGRDWAEQERTEQASTGQTQPGSAD